MPEIRTPSRRPAAKRTAETAVDASLPDLLRLSHDIHAHPELSYEEVRSSALAAAALERGGFMVTTGDSRPPHRVHRRGRVGSPGPRHLRRVRRPPRRRSRLRAQHHRRIRRRRRARTAATGRRTRADRPGGGHPGRGGRGRQGRDAGAGRLRRRPRRHDGPPVADRPARGHVPRRVPLRRGVHGPDGTRVGGPVAGRQRSRRHGDRPGGPRAAPPAAPARRPGPRRGHQRRRGRQHHPGPRHRTIHGPLPHPPGSRAARAAGAGMLPRRGPGHRGRCRGSSRSRPTTRTWSATTTCSTDTAPTPRPWDGGSHSTTRARPGPRSRPTWPMCRWPCPPSTHCWPSTPAGP